MKNFKLIKQNIPTQPFLDQIDSIANAWAGSTGRQDKIMVQREALAIPLRGLRKSAIVGRKRRDVHESRWTTSSKQYPLFVQFLKDFAKERNEILGRAKIVCLPAGKQVYPHIDRGEYYRVRNRYHLVLRSSLGSWMKTGDEEVRMREGELWWFDNNEVHEARNDGDQDRIHVIFDMLPAELEHEVFKADPAASKAVLAN